MLGKRSGRSYEILGPIQIEEDLLANIKELLIGINSHLLLLIIAICVLKVLI